MGIFRTNRRLGILSLAVLLASLAGSGVAALVGSLFEARVASGGIFLWVCLAPLFSLLMATGFLPSTIVALFAGYFLGWESLFFIIPVYLLASLKGYFFTRKIDKGQLADSLKSKPAASEILKGIRKNEAGMIFLARLSPSLPFSLMNILLAATGVRFYNFLFAGLAGMLPRTCLAVYVAGFARELKDLMEQEQAFTWETYAILFLFVFSFAGMIFLLRKALRAAVA